MSKRQRLEFILLSLFFVSGICTLFKVHYSTWGVALSGFFLGGLYFYFAFWLFAEFSISLIIRIIVGLFYSIVIVACLFCFLKWPLWQLYSLISFIAMGVILLIYLFNRKSPGYKQLMYRSIFFVIVLSMVYGYTFFHINSTIN
jgi:hypothetical protein